MGITDQLPNLRVAHVLNALKKKNVQCPFGYEDSSYWFLPSKLLKNNLSVVSAVTQPGDTLVVKHNTPVQSINLTASMHFTERRATHNWPTSKWYDCICGSHDHYCVDTDKLWDSRTHVMSKYHLRHYKLEATRIHQTPLNIRHPEISYEIPERALQMLPRDKDYVHPTLARAMYRNPSDIDVEEIDEGAEGLLVRSAGAAATLV